MESFSVENLQALVMIVRSPEIKKAVEQAWEKTEKDVDIILRELRSVQVKAG